LLQILIDNDHEGAIKAAAANLKCPYTNADSWKLLSSIWQEQAKSVKDNVHFYQSIGDVLANVGMHNQAVVYYSSAARHAFNSKSIGTSKSLSSAALVELTRFKASLKNDESDEEGIDSATNFTRIACSVYADAGSIDVALYLQVRRIDSNDEYLTSYENKDDDILNAAKRMLAYALQPHCVFVNYSEDQEHREGQLSDGWMRAINSLQQLYDAPSFLIKSDLAEAATLYSLAANVSRKALYLEHNDSSSVATQKESLERLYTLYHSLVRTVSQLQFLNGKVELFSASTNTN
jgi:hypothetical protein